MTTKAAFQYSHMPDLIVYWINSCCSETGIFN